jgi:peroxiredoxin
VIDKEGIVRMAYNATLAAEPHVQRALEAVGAAAGNGLSGRSG